MKHHVHSIAMLVFASLIALPCLAAGPSLRPGLWEYTSHRSGAGVVLPPELSRLSPEQQAKFRKAMTGIETGQHTMTTHSCLTADQIRHMSFNPEKGRDEKECKSTVKQLSSDRWSMTTHCSRKEGSEQDISGTMHVIDSGHVEQDVTISMREGAQQNHQQMHMVGHWISADCGKAD